MELVILRLLFMLGLVLLFFSLRKPPLKEWLLCYLLAAYFGTFLGDLAAKHELISYPVKLFTQFQSSVLYEYLLLPLLSIYFYRNTYRSSMGGCYRAGGCLQQCFDHH